MMKKVHLTMTVYIINNQHKLQPYNINLYHVLLRHNNHFVL